MFVRSSQVSSRSLARFSQAFGSVVVFAWAMLTVVGCPAQPLAEDAGRLDAGSEDARDAGLVVDGGSFVDGGASSDGGQNGIDEDEAAYIDAFVSYYARCLFGADGVGLVAIEGAEGAARVGAEWSAYLRRSMMANAMALTTRVFDPIAGERCANALNDADCSNFPDAACASVYVGVQAIGDDCSSRGDCASGVCERNVTNDCAVCVADAPVGEGQSCFARECTDDAHCDVNYDDVTEQTVAICVGYRTEGEVCREFTPGGPIYNPCAPGLQCVTALDVCRGPVAAFGDCTELGGANGDFLVALDCVDGFFCGSNSEVCEPRAAQGEICSVVEEGEQFVQCLESLRCVSDTDLGVDTCVPYPALGESCGGINRCDGANYCHPASAICLSLPQVGEECTWAYACASDDLRCDYDSEVCVVDHPLGTVEGAPCTDGGAGCAHPFVCEGALGNQTCVAPPANVIVGVGEDCSDVNRSCGVMALTGLVCAPDADVDVCQSIVVVELGEACDEIHRCRHDWTAARCDNGVCVARAAKGEACGTLLGGTVHCAWLLACDADVDTGEGVCRESRFEGESCQDQQLCSGGECVNGICTALAVDGCE